MEEPFARKVLAIKNKFSTLSTPDSRYAYLIELGRAATPYPMIHRVPEFLVPGCQSTLYLHVRSEDRKLFFTAHSDALISAGLAALLILAYDGCTPQTILQNPPTFLQEIGLLASLSPNRASGLASIFTRMKQEALKELKGNFS